MVLVRVPDGALPCPLKRGLRLISPRSQQATKSTPICGPGKDALTLQTLLVRFNITLPVCTQSTGVPLGREVYGFGRSC